jgi:hypothetical protein
MFEHSLPTEIKELSLDTFDVALTSKLDERYN